MKKWLALLICLILALAAACALAGATISPDENGIVYSSGLVDNTEIDSDATLVINTTTAGESTWKQSVRCKGKLKIQVSNTNFLMLRNNSGAAVTAKDIELAGGTTVLYPQDFQILEYAGEKFIADSNDVGAPFVVIGPKGWYATRNGVMNASEIKSAQNVLLLNDTMLFLDESKAIKRIYDPGKEFDLQITENPGSKAVLSVHGGKDVHPIEVGSADFDMTSVTLLNPVYGSFKDGIALEKNGQAATWVQFAPRGDYLIDADEYCYAVDEINHCFNSGYEGHTVRVYPFNAPAGTWLSAVYSTDVEIIAETDMGGDFMYRFTMPAKDVDVKAVYAPQTPYTLDLRGKTKIPTEEPGILGCIYRICFYTSSKYTKIGDVYYFDLDGDGHYDITQQNVFEYNVADTCNLEKWYAVGLTGCKYEPFTIIFRDPPGDPAPEPPTSATVGKLKYKLSGSKAIVTGPKSKSATSLTIPKTIKVQGKTYKVTEIKAAAFKGMKKLTAVTIGENIKTIGKEAFRNCAKLKTITIKSRKLTASSIKSNAFKGIYKKATFKCPKGKVKAYKKILLKKGAPKTCKFK